jgi:hypothetical protein
MCKRRSKRTTGGGSKHTLRGVHCTKIHKILLLAPMRKMARPLKTGGEVSFFFCEAGWGREQRKNVGKIARLVCLSVCTLLVNALALLHKNRPPETSSLFLSLSFFLCLVGRSLWLVRWEGTSFRFPLHCWPSWVRTRIRPTNIKRRSNVLFVWRFGFFVSCSGQK